ncbi:hypothetical protein ACHAWC_010495 [Mediolabrus comicus]
MIDSSMQHPTFKRRRKTRSMYIILILLGACFSGSLASSNSNERNKGQQRHAQNQDNNNANNKAEQMLFSFFDKLHSLEETYGSNLVTVQNAADLYPILSQTSAAATAASSGDCPNYHHYSSSSDNHFKMQPGKKGSCYTPIITIHDRITNSMSMGSSSQQQQQQQEQYYYNYLPEVLLISGLDTPSQMDILGPSSIYETLKLLLDCALCEALSPWVSSSSSFLNDTSSSTSNAQEGDAIGDTIDAISNSHEFSANTNAIQCRNDLQSQGIDDKTRKWLARLVATRKIIAVPIVDVAGFYKRLEMEEAVDSSSNSQTTSSNNVVDHADDSAEFSWSRCDFPYPTHWETSSSSSTTSCMHSFPSQIMNEVFRSNAIQLGLAFHGRNDDFLLPTGWIGVPTWRSEMSSSTMAAATTSPEVISIDEDAMTEIGWAYSMFGALSYSVQSIPPKFKLQGNVDEERVSNECHGATLEHWAFSAGMTISDEADSGGGSIWLEQCNSDYPPERTTHYDTLSLRGFVASVVAPPLDNEYPSCLPGFEVDDEILCLPDSNDQHFFFDSSRVGSNLRMSLLATELVEPWTSIRSIAGVELRDDDVIPLSQRLPERCPEARSMTLPESILMKDVNITWTVGGAFTVTETAIMHGKWNVLDKKIFDCITQPTKQELDAFFTILRDFEVMEGETAQEMDDDVSFTPVQSGVTRWHPSHLNTAARVPTERAETKFSVSLDLSDYKAGDVVALYALARTDQREPMENPPQSSFVNARTNPDWSHSYTGTEGPLTMKGRLDWFSVPVTITIGEQPGFFESKQPIETSVRISDVGLIVNNSVAIGDIIYPLMAAIVAVAVVFFCAFCREESDGTDVFSVLKEHREIKRQKISMDDFFREESEDETVQLELT